MCVISFQSFPFLIALRVVTLTVLVSVSVQISQYIDRVLDEFSEAERTDICTMLRTEHYDTVGDLPYYYDDYDGWERLMSVAFLDRAQVEALQRARPTVRVGSIHITL